MGRSNAQVATDVVDAAGDAVGDVADDLVDLAEVAASSAVVAGRAGFRIVRRTIRFVASHPRGVLASVVIVTAGLAALKFVRSGSSSTDTA